jgi:hypothetical protein
MVDTAYLIERTPSAILPDILGGCGEYRSAIPPHPLGWRRRRMDIRVGYSSAMGVPPPWGGSIRTENESGKT